MAVPCPTQLPLQQQQQPLLERHPVSFWYSVFLFDPHPTRVCVCMCVFAEVLLYRILSCSYGFCQRYSVVFKRGYLGGTISKMLHFVLTGFLYFSKYLVYGSFCLLKCLYCFLTVIKIFLGVSQLLHVTPWKILVFIVLANVKFEFTYGPRYLKSFRSIPFLKHDRIFVFLYFNSNVLFFEVFISRFSINGSLIDKRVIKLYIFSGQIYWS